MPHQRITPDDRPRRWQLRILLRQNDQILPAPLCVDKRGNGRFCYQRLRPGIIQRHRQFRCGGAEIDQGCRCAKRRDRHEGDDPFRPVVHGNRDPVPFTETCFAQIPLQRRSPGK